MVSIASASPVTRARRLGAYLSELWRRREFALHLGLGNLKARNASTSLGLLWWVINPLLLGGVYYLVFGVLLPGSRPEGFLAYLLSGMFVFHFTSQSMTGGANSIIQNSKLLVNLRFPRLILPISALIESAVGFLASLVVFYVITMPLGQAFPSLYLLFLPVLLTIHVLFCLGLSCFTARLAVPFRDINNIIPYATRLWLYMSPIIWPLSRIENAPTALRNFIEANPMYHIIALYRSILFGNPIDPVNVMWALGWSVAVGVLGTAVFIRYEGNIVRYL